MDEADRAQKDLDVAIDTTVRNIQQEQEALSRKPPAKHCTNCGEPIPAARREAVPGCHLCVYCAELLENSNRGIQRT